MNQSEQKDSTNTTVYVTEDDGFYNDIAISSSLSKSLLALNKYVKKNLLYDDSEDQTEEINNDGAYFSKESSPNDSVVKSDTESDKSNELRMENSDAISKVNVNVSVTEDKSDPTKQTDDYKFKKLLENPTSHRDLNSSNNSCNSNNNSSHSRRYSLEDNDSQVACGTKNYEENIVSRRSIANIEKPQRHSVHDVNWVNRTNIYPDVYAPLPFSKFSMLYYKYINNPK